MRRDMEGEDSIWVDAERKFSMQMQVASVTPQHRIAIAVSGGADSLALCLLAARWKRRSSDVGAVKNEGLVAFVVDHGLRSGSAEEAMRVRQWVSNLGLVCDILKCVWVDGVPALGHLQESARNARYSLLAHACQLCRAEILLTAHHADDQAELFILRLSRCSGIAGLAGMASVKSLHPALPACATKRSVPFTLLLIRPLLKFVKEELYNICRVSGQEWIEDPTNLNLHFARNCIRKALKELSFMRVRTEIQELVAFCRKIRSILDRDRDCLLSQVSQVSHKWGHATIDVPKLLSSGVSNAVLHRAVEALMQFVAQKANPPRGRVVGSVIKHLRAKHSKGAFTAGGCNVFPAPGSKGSTAIICLSPDSPPPSGPRAAHLHQSIQSLSSELCTPFTKVPLLLNVDPGDPILDKFTANAISKAIAGLALDIKTSRTAVHEFQGLGLISEAGASLLRELASDISRDMGKQPANQSEETWRVKWKSTFRERGKKPLSFGRSEYFLDRFVVSLSSRIQELVDVTQPSVYELHTDPLPRDCPVLRQKMWIRHFEEKDWVFLSRLAAQIPGTQDVRVCDFKADVTLCDPSRQHLSKLDCIATSKHHARGLNEHLRALTAPSLHNSHGASSPSSVERYSSNQLHKVGPCRRPWCQIERISKAKDAVAQLQTIPKRVRRGLPVIVTTRGLLFGLPSVGYAHCPLALVNAVFCPRTPLGGGQASWL